ncbi:SDR family oxidoreductase [Caballeronia novacaledonica]|uniref:SDR family oxidoreductase n=1 Tax=Caballeronia novacaledonica TaxID=1544861 RepID=UPI000470986E|nr:SDR family oxidoreductase [Caballeronia novacaledonica]GJH14538.1 SDR family oxidoreductase [Caballeronia novacaledonica]
MPNRTIFVTGASQGVGEAVARHFSVAGDSNIVLVARDSVRLNRVARELQDKGCETLAVQADLSNVEDCRRAVKEAETKFGSIDVICNCAGLTLRGDIFNTTVDTFDSLFAVNVRASFFVIQTALPGMIAAKRGGVVINISSMLSYGGPSFLLPYAATKAALNVITKNVANTVKFERIRVHAINLGWTDTPAEHETQTKVHGLPEDWATSEGKKQPFGRLLKADDPAKLCVFLASDNAAMMTGCVIDQEQWVAGTLS